MKSGETGYFTIPGYSQHELLGKVASWCNAVGIRIGPPIPMSTLSDSPAFPPPPSPSLSVADELVKLAAIRDQGILSPEEYEEQKAKLLGR